MGIFREITLVIIIYVLLVKVASEPIIALKNAPIISLLSCFKSSAAIVILKHVLPQPKGLSNHTQLQVVSLIWSLSLAEGVRICDMSCWKLFLWNETCINQVWEKRRMSRILNNASPCHWLPWSFPGFPSLYFLHWLSVAVISNLVAWCCCLQLPKEYTPVLISAPHTVHSLHNVTTRCGILPCITPPALSLSLMNYILITQVSTCPAKMSGAYNWSSYLKSIDSI